MLVVGFRCGPLQANCYLLAAAAGGPCVVVDPGEEAGVPLRAALAEHRLVPAAVLATHGHPDHVASAGELDLPLHLHAADADRYDGESVPLEPGTHTFAGLGIDVRPVPGHTPGSVVFDLATGEGGRIALTGDTLFAGSIGRAVDGGELARAVRDLLEPLPDETVLLPGHGPATTAGRERAGNPFLAGTGA